MLGQNNVITDVVKKRMIGIKPNNDITNNPIIESIKIFFQMKVNVKMVNKTILHKRGMT